MGLFSSFSHGILIILFLPLLTTCSSFKTMRPSYVIKIQGEKGKIEHSSITIRRESSYYEKGELSHRTVRNLKLRIQSEVESIDSQGIWVKNTTLEKEGQENLHGFGFPELKETIRLKLNFQGKVLKVEGHKKDSVFYLPPIVLPSGPVKKGDHWSESFQWKSADQGQHFQTTFTSEFLGTDAWEKKDGLKIKLIAYTEWKNIPKDFTFSSQSKGYYLWDPIKENVIYSESEAKDSLESQSKDTRMVTLTTFMSRSD